MSELLPLLVAGPLAAAALVTALHRFVGRTVLDLIALATALAVAAGAFALVEAARHGPIVIWLGGWRPREGAAFGIALAADVLGSGFLLLIAGLVAAVLVFARLYFAELGGLFQAILMVFLGATAGFCLTGDLFNLYVFFELVGVSAFVLTAYRMEEDALHGAFTFAVLSSLAGMLVLAGTGVLYALTGSVNLAQIGRVLSVQGDSGAMRLAFVLIATGLLIKAAAVPFHFWLADAYAGAAAPVCVLFGGASVTLGVFGLARVIWTVFAGALPHDLVSTILLPLGVLTAIYAPLIALVEPNLKRVLALTTVSHVGVLLVAIGLMSVEGLAGGAHYLLGHALVKAGLFVAAGLMIARFGSSAPDRIGGASGAAFPAVLLALGGLMLAGLPGSAAAIGKHVILEAADAVGRSWTGPLLTLASSASGAAVLIASGRLAFTPPSDQRARPPPPAGSGLATAAIAMILFGAATLATFPGAAAAIAGGANALASSPAYAAAVLDGAVAAPQVASGSSHGRVGGHALFAPLGAVLIAALVLSIPKLPSLARGPLDAMLGAARALHRLHTGHIGDYVAWATVGLSVIGIASAISGR